MKSMLDALADAITTCFTGCDSISKMDTPINFDTMRMRASVYLIDRSGSMSANDILPSRYVAACNAVGHAVNARRRVSSLDLSSVIALNDLSCVLCKDVRVALACERIGRELSYQSPSGGTSISCGLRDALDVLNGTTNDFAKHLVILSDGHDGGRPYSLAQEIKSSGVLVDCIGVGRSPSDVDEKCLKRIASVLDGVIRYRFITNADDLNEHFEAISTGICKRKT